jgi:hypothetical protein
MIAQMRSGVYIDGLVELCKFLNNANVYEILEVGSFAFESGKIFAEYMKKVVCVDPWVQGYDLTDVASQSDMTEVERAFDLRASKFNNVTKLKMTSEGASSLFENKSLKAVYLDGCHKRKCIEEDVRLWLPKIEPGFFICGHDYASKKHPGIKEVVDGILGPPDKIFQDSSWVKQIKAPL